MADITSSRFQDLLKRLLTTKGPAPGTSVLDDVHPTLDIQDVYRPEQRAMRGERDLST